MEPWDFLNAIKRFSKTGKIVGTCAGAILLAKDVIPNQRSLSLVDISVDAMHTGVKLIALLASRMKAVSRWCLFVRRKSVEWGWV